MAPLKQGGCDMTNDGTMTGGSDFKDRKTGLVVFGILEIIMGAFCALMVPFMLIGMAASAALNKGPSPSMSAGTLIPSILFYILLAVWFIWMGIGSIKARRWARALLLVVSWFWLVSGLIGLIFVLVLLPDMYDQLGKSGQMPPQVVAVVKYMMIGFMTVFYVIIPGVLVLFYGSRHVKATCELRDPQVRWTDKCPVPVLAVSLMAGFWAACMPLMGFYGWAIPFFGYILGGMAGALVAFVSILLLAYVAWGAYRLNIKAWWCAMLLLIIWGVSTGITFSRVSLMEYYEKMNFPPQQLEIIKQFAFTQTSGIVLFCGLWVAVALAYLLYTRRYFVPIPGTRPSR